MMYFNHPLTIRFTKPLIGLAALFGSWQAFGQTNMHWNHYSVYNPAMSGVLNRQDAAITGTYLSSPTRTITGFLADYNARIGALHGGVGISYAGGAYNSYAYGQLNANYSYHIKTGTNSLLALGVSAGLVHNTIPKDTWTPGGISASRSSAIALTTGLGISYRYKNLNTGFSVQRLNEPTLRGEGYSFKFPRNYNFFIDYKWQLTKNLVLQPSLLLASNGGYWGSSIALRAIYKERYMLGLSSSGGGNSFMLGYTFKNNLSVTYSLEILANLKQVGSTGSLNHGLTLRFQLK